MKRKSWSISFVVLFFFASQLAAQHWQQASPEEVGLSSERLQHISQVFQRYISDKQLAGAVIFVARHGKIAYHEAFGMRDIENGSAMPKDGIFRIASQSKALVSTAAMILQERGALLLSDPVSKFIPEFAKTTVATTKDDGSVEIVPAKREITVHDLLTHTSGASYGNGPAKDQWAAAGIQGWYFADREEPIADTIKRLAALPFDTQPGERFVYGYSTDILGVVVERASGQPLDVFLRENIFTPLGMNDTQFYLQKDQIERFVTVYSLGESGTIERTPDSGTMVSQGAYMQGPRKSFSGGAGLLSTAKDYATFLQMMLNGGEFHGQRILSRKTVELMTVDHLGQVYNRSNGTGFGLGFWVLEDLGARKTLGTVGEFGWGGAYHTTYWVDPQEQLVVSYMTQLIPARGIRDHEMVRTLVYQAIVD